MTRTRITITIDEDVLRAARVRAARTHARVGELIEAAVRRDLGLELLDRLWERNAFGEAEAIALAVEAQHVERQRND